MRILLFFDLPTDSPKSRKDYRIFRKFLIDEGFIMMQYSVYMRLVMNNVSAEMTIAKVRRHKPSAGDIMILKVTERQFARMEYVLGNSPCDMTTLATNERLVFLGGSSND